ncbi:L-lactate permease [Salinicoccus halitifaciens]|uniref:L-lactate permease n=1 Tax=Salinicoccus halitifaciens TaxID=1073415 RepID=A0ABV2E6V2_9STAP|nr:L-lactate permease [Salinicoccus halitifaciens]MCD2136796.1 L-lactate permease [Salinicoccus halitifaciens]
MDHSLPLDILHWSMAALPLALLLIMLVVFRWSGGTSGWIAAAVAAAIAYFLYEAPLDNMAVGVGKGLWEALFILLVVWTALFLYHSSKKAGAFEVIREDIEDYSQNYLFLVLAFGWVFSSFLQGVAGFGVPIAVVAPLLIGIGVKPVAAVVIPLIGHLWANMFGTVGVGWIATINAVEIENITATLFYTTLMLWAVNLLSGLSIAFIYAGWQGIKDGFLLIITISIIHGGGQMIVAMFSPELSAFIPAAIAMAALILFAKTKKYGEKSKSDEKTKIMQDPEDREETEEERPDISIHKAFMPYYVLTVLTVVALGVPTISNFLDQIEFGPPFPETETGYGFTEEGTAEYSPISLTHPAIYILLGAIFGVIWYKRLGLYDSGYGKEIWDGVKDNALGASLAIAGFLTMTEVMGASGQITVLALGIGTVANPPVYLALANFIGLIGSFMTSSNTSSNVVFAPLHGSVANAMDGLSLPQAIAAQSTGGAIGNAIAPSNIILATSTAGIQDKIADVYKQTLIFTLIAALMVSGISLIIYFLV